MRKSVRALALAAGVVAAGPAAAETIANPAAKPIAVLDFEDRDTSGEARDQGAEHRARLGAFMAKLRADLARIRDFRSSRSPARILPAPPAIFRRKR